MASTKKVSTWLGLLPLFAAALLLGACQTETAVDEQAEPELPEDEVAIEDPWVEPASTGDSTSLYMTIANGRASTDTLVDVRAPIIGDVEFRRPATDTSSATSAESLDSLPVPSEMRTALEPNGPYIVLTDLSQSLTEESSIVLDLVFSQSGRQRVRVPVRTEGSSDGQ